MLVAKRFWLQISKHYGCHLASSQIWFPCLLLCFVNLLPTITTIFLFWLLKITTNVQHWLLTIKVFGILFLIIATNYLFWFTTLATTNIFVAHQKCITTKIWQQLTFFVAKSSNTICLFFVAFYPPKFFIFSISKKLNNNYNNK